MVSSNENKCQPLSSGEVEGMSWQGPRTFLLQKNLQGFGFTLRHFIVFPPVSSLYSLKVSRLSKVEWKQHTLCFSTVILFFHSLPISLKRWIQTTAVCWYGELLPLVQAENVLASLLLTFNATVCSRAAFCPNWSKHRPTWGDGQSMFSDTGWHWLGVSWAKVLCMAMW